MHEAEIHRTAGRTLCEPDPACPNGDNEGFAADFAGEILIGNRRTTSGECSRDRNRRGGPQSFRSSGTFPPFSASFCMTALCSHKFTDAELSVSPMKSSSAASSLRADRLHQREELVQVNE